MTFATSTGIYNITLWDIYTNNSQLPSKAKPLVTAIVKLSEETCIDIDPIRIMIDLKLSQINSLLTSNYELNDYTVSNLQINLQSDKAMYKYLFVNSKYKQILFLVS